MTIVDGKIWFRRYEHQDKSQNQFKISSIFSDESLSNKVFKKYYESDTFESQNGKTDSSPSVTET